MDARTRRCVVRRSVLAAVPPVLALVVIAGGYSLLADRLPPRALHTGGYLDSTTWSQALTVRGMWVVGFAVVAVAMLIGSRRLATSSLRWAVPMTWVSSVFSAGSAVALFLTHLAVPPPSPDPWWTATGVAAPALVVVGLLGWWAAGPEPALPAADGGPGPDAPRMPLRAGERAVWVRSVVARPALALAAVWVVLAVTSRSSLLAVLFAVAALLAAAQAWARVRVDARGVVVEQPLLRRPLVGVETAHVREAGVVAVEELGLPRYGGFGVLSLQDVWGYRATRTGPALRLATSDGRAFVVTVPDAATAAALVNTEIDRRVSAG